MSIQVYECRDHGKTEVFLRGLQVPPRHSCPRCGKPIPHVISAPALVGVQETWNDIANRCRVNPYDQAKEQLKNHDREQQERFDARPMKITEEQIQVAAKGIYESERRPPVSEEARVTQRIRAAKERDRKQEV